uniref:Uncharacterized protein n=1 Tax=Rhizophora mucronata TaxID=61149 RepID=A0A2P2Q6R6_RHIMU
MRNRDVLCVMMSAMLEIFRTRKHCLVSLSIWQDNLDIQLSPSLLICCITCILFCAIMMWCGPLLWFIWIMCCFVGL